MYRPIWQFLKLLRSLFSEKEPEKPEKIHLVDLAKVMARFEGYYLVKSRAKRNKNPLNLKWSPFTKILDTGGFCIFPTAYAGWRAGLWDLEKKCKGFTRTSLKPTSTIRDLIFTWSATDQESYLQFVIQELKIPSDYQLKEFNLEQIFLTLLRYLDEGKI